MNMDVQAIDNSAPVAPAPPLPAASQGAPAGRTLNPDETLHRVLSQLVGGGSNVSVQFRVVPPNEIVTVFTDQSTGRVINQFPSEAMVLIAQFFNKLAGAVLDKSA